MQIGERYPVSQIPKIPIDNIAEWNAEKMHRAEAMADRIQARLQNHGIPADLLFYGCQLTILLPHEVGPLVNQLRETKEATIAIKLEVENVSSFMGLAISANHAETVRLAKYAQLASESPDLMGLAIAEQDWLLRAADITEILETGQSLVSLHRQYDDIFIPEAWEQDIIDIRQNLLAYGDKWYKFLKPDYKKSIKKLAALCKTDLPRNVSEKLQYTDAISEARRLNKILTELEPVAIRLFGNRWQKNRSDWTALSKAATYLLEIHRQVSAADARKNSWHFYRGTKIQRFRKAMRRPWYKKCVYSSSV